jgi:5-methylthioadenosine/S-adenosylhomocysteine deaminase
MDSLKIIANAFVLTCDPENRGGRYHILIRDGRIAEISESLEFFASAYPYAMVIDAGNKLVTPGFVNAHFHSESVLLRECTDGVHFGLWRQDDRFRSCHRRLVEQADEDDILPLYLTSYFSHLKSGTTCIGEYGPPTSEKGLVLLTEAIERSGVKGLVALQNWDHIRKARQLKTKRPRFAINLGKEEDYTVYTFENLVRIARELKFPLLAHVAEQREDVESVRRNFQKSVIAVMQYYNALAPNTLLVHLNHITEQEVESVEKTGSTVVLCARSAAYKQTGFPSLRHLCSHNVRLAIGTDWALADMVGEMKFLHDLHLLVHGIRPFDPLELVRMATLNGAYALGLSEETGSIETGKRADLTFFSLAGLHLPAVKQDAVARELADYLVRHLTTKDVSDVMIDGEFCVSQGQTLAMSEEDIVERFRQTRERFYADHQGEKRRSMADGTIQKGTIVKPKILPLIPEARGSVNEGFLEGFSSSTKAASTFDAVKRRINTQAPPLPSAKEDKPVSKPELSKDVKRVFGEDDEF